MSWEETVLSDEEVDDIKLKRPCFLFSKERLEAQAEKSYAAGMRLQEEEITNLWADGYKAAYAEGKAEGRRDVIEWLRETNIMPESRWRHLEIYDDRQTLLKELEG